MSLPIGNSFVRNLGTLLGFPGGATIKEVSEQIVPVIDASTVAEWGLGSYGRFWRTISATSAANPNSTVVNPQNAAHWTQIDFGSEDGVVTRAQGDVWVMSFGMYASVPANFTDGSLQLRGGPANQELLLWRSTGIDAAGHVYGEFEGSGPPPFSLKTLNNSGAFPRVHLNVSGNVDVTIIMDVLSGPIGLFPRK